MSSIQKFDDSQSFKTLLDRSAWIVLPISVCAYVFLQSLMIVVSSPSKDGTPSIVCNQQIEIPRWVQGVNFGAGFSFVGNSILQFSYAFNKFFSKNSNNDEYNSQLFAMHLSVLTVHLIAASSQFIHYFEIYPNICRDGFGVYSTGSQWPEWIISVPLLAYLGCSVVSKDEFSSADLAYIFNIVAMISSGTMILVDPTHSPIYYTIAMASYCMIPFLQYRMQEADKPTTSALQLDSLSNPRELTAFLVEHQRQWREKILTQLFYICFYFPTIYVLGLYEILSPATTCACYMAGSLLGKLLFSSSLAQSYMALNDSLQQIRVATLRSDQTRRTFLRYVFHELRIPLNSLAVGMQLLDYVVPADTLTNENDKEIIDSLKLSTASLVDNVNQVLDLHRIREKELQLKPVPFNFREWLLTGLEFPENCKVKPVIEMDERIAQIIYADPKRLNLIVTSLYSGLITCVKAPSEIFIRFSTTPPSHIKQREIMINSSYNQLLGLHNHNHSHDRQQQGIFERIFKPKPVGEDKQPLLEKEREYDEQDLFITFTSTEFNIPMCDMIPLFEPFFHLRTADQQEKHGVGLSIALASELLALHHGSELMLLDKSADEAAQVLLHLRLPVDFKGEVATANSNQQSATKETIVIKSPRQESSDQQTPSVSTDADKVNSTSPATSKAATAADNMAIDAASQKMPFQTIIPHIHTTIPPERVDDIKVSGSSPVYWKTIASENRKVPKSVRGHILAAECDDSFPEGKLLHVLIVDGKMRIHELIYLHASHRSL